MKISPVIFLTASCFMLIEKIATRYLLVEIDQKLRTKTSGRLKCIVTDAGQLTYETCPENENNSCYFKLNGNAKDVGILHLGCSSMDAFINTCHKDNSRPNVFCWCNGDGCNVYCSAVDCKPKKIQYNSTNVDFPKVLNSPLKEWDEECTAKCWPNVPWVSKCSMTLWPKRLSKDFVKNMLYKPLQKQT